MVRFKTRVPAAAIVYKQFTAGWVLVFYSSECVLCGCAPRPCHIPIANELKLFASDSIYICSVCNNKQKKLGEGLWRGLEMSPPPDERKERH